METNKKNTIYLFSPPDSTNDFVGGLKNVKEYPISVLETDNNYAEWIFPNKEMKPFVDLDGKDLEIDGANEMAKHLTFMENNKNILNALKSIKEMSILCSSNKNYNNGKGKYSFRITFHTFKVKSINDCRLFAEHYAYPKLKELFDRNPSLPPLAEYGKQIKNGVDFDTSVYRNGQGGKMRTINSFKKSENGLPHRMETGNDKTKYLIHYLNGDEKEYTPPQKPIKKIKTKLKKLTKTKQNKTTQKNTEITELSNLISLEYIDNYQDWIKIVWALETENEYDLAKLISSKSDKWKVNKNGGKTGEEMFETLWNKNTGGVSLKTIHYYAKKSNETKYKEIQKKYKSKEDDIKFALLKEKGFKLNDTSDDNLADIGILFIGDLFIYQNDNLFVWIDKDRTWRLDNKGELSKELIKDLIKGLNQKHLDNLNELQKEEDDEDKKNPIEDEIKKFLTLKGKILSSNKQSSVLSCVKNKLKMRNDKVDFDSTLPYILNFKNLAIDLLTGNEYILKKEDYITQNTGYNYVEPTEEQINNIHKLIISIMPKEERRKTLCSVLFCAMTGIRDEKFFICQGTGGNGKGLINEQLLIALGDEYSARGNINLLTQKLKDGVNEELSKLDKKRMVKFEEPNETDKCLLGNIKKLTGEGAVDCRGLYQKSGNINLFATFLFELNDRIQLSGRIDTGVSRRFNVLKYEQKFTDKESDLKDKDNHFQKANPLYKRIEWQKEHRTAIIKYLILNAEKKLYIDAETERESAKYLSDNDEIQNWFLEEYEQIEGCEEPLQLKNVYDRFKQSDIWRSFSKDEQRRMNRSKFFETMQCNLVLGKYYKDKYNYTNEENKKTCMRNVLKGGWQPKLSLDLTD